MNLAALPATPEPEMPFARHQRNSQRSTLVVVISGDGELLTSAPNCVADETPADETSSENCVADETFNLSRCKLSQRQLKSLAVKEKNRLRVPKKCARVESTGKVVIVRMWGLLQLEK